MKNLKNYGVQELSIKEQKETEGGVLFVLFGAVIGLGILLGWLISNPN